MAGVAADVTAVVLADTHIRSNPDGSLRRWLPAPAEPYLAAADVVLHAGDVVDNAVLERLRTYAPVHAVLGNNDTGMERVLPDTLSLDLAGVSVVLVHDTGPTSGRAKRMRARFPSADVVVFGHSHMPLVEGGVDGQLLFNPGSPTQRRAQPRHTLGLLRLAGGQVTEATIVPLD